MSTEGRSLREQVDITLPRMAERIAELEQQLREAQEALTQPIRIAGESFTFQELVDRLEQLDALREACVKEGNLGRGYHCMLCGAWWVLDGEPYHSRGCALLAQGQPIGPSGETP